MPGGRPTAMTDEVIAKLEQAFLLGCTDREACMYADIVPSTLYRFCQSNPAFSERKEVLKEKQFWKARQVLSDALDNGDVATAHKVIDRKEGSKLSISGADGGPVLTERTVRLVRSGD